jgi:hypothetical protein
LKASQFTVGGHFLFGNFNEKWDGGERQLLESFQVKGIVKDWINLEVGC